MNDDDRSISVIEVVVMVVVALFSPSRLTRHYSIAFSYEVNILCVLLC